jgi:hypothetical protein
MDFRKAGRKYEKGLADEYGAEKSPGSGNQWASPNDFRTSKFLFETKYTTKNFYTLNLKDLEDLSLRASRTKRTGVLIVGFYRGKEISILEIEDFLYLNKDTEAPSPILIKAKGNSTFRLSNSLLKQGIIELQFSGNRYILMSRKFFDTNIL